MQQREKLLLIFLVTAGSLWFLLPNLESLLLGPVASLRSRRDSLESTVDRLENRQGQILASVRELADWTESSLPPNPNIAQSVYQVWLVQLAELAGCSTPKVSLDARVTRGDVFTVVPVRLTMQGTLEQLARFVSLYESTRLAHSIADLKVTSTGFDGNPRFELTLKCEGISIHDAADRTRLFPQAMLASAITAGDRKLTLRSDSEFDDIESLLGQRIRIGTELLNIVEVDGLTWTVERAVDGTLAAAASADHVVELMPRRDAAPEDPLSQWEPLLAANPFTKPEPPFVYSPRITAVPDQLVIQGIPWSLTLDAPGWDPDSGSPLFAFDSEVPEGLTLDRSTGRLSWETDEDTPIGDWDVTVRAVASRDSDIVVSTEFEVSLRMVNLPPIVTVPSRLMAYSGQPIDIEFTAEDPDGDSSKLQFTPSGSTADGVEIDRTTQTITWTPPLELDLGEYTLEIDVEDDGDPSEVVTARIRVEVVEDDAFFTYFVGLMTIDEEPEAWFFNRMSQQEGYFQVGDKLEVSNIGGEIVSISPDRVVLKNEEELFEIINGGNVRDRQILETFETSVESEETETAPSGSEDAGVDAESPKRFQRLMPPPPSAADRRYRHR